LATRLDIFALALAKHRIAGNIRVSRVFGITPSGVEPIFKTFRVRGAIVFLPVGDMGLPLQWSDGDKIHLILSRDLLVLLTGGGSLRGGVYLCHFVYIDQSREDRVDEERIFVGALYKRYALKLARGSCQSCALGR